MSQRILVPVDLPGWIYRPLGRIKRAVVAKREQVIDLSGDRVIEYSFVASRIPMGTGPVLDFGAITAY
jgi:hypothetical protein